MGKKKKKGERKGKKTRKKTKRVKKSDFYEMKGEGMERKRKVCPKCGQGVFMAEHKDRFSCGKCAYTEWKKQVQND